jgi:hypothetical protein
VSQKIVISLTSILLYVKVTHFVFWFGRLPCVSCFFCGGILLITLVLYLLLCNIYMIVLFSVSFAFSVLDMYVIILMIN